MTEPTHVGNPTEILPEGPGEKLEEVHVYDNIIVEEECCSVERNTVQKPQPALKRIKKARSSIPTEMAPGVPDAVPDHCTGHIPRLVTGERQISNIDEVYDNLEEDFDYKQSPRSSISTCAEIYDHDLSAKRCDSPYEPIDNNHIQIVQVPQESHYLKLQHHSMASDVYTDLDQQNPTGDLGIKGPGPPTIYYINQSEIWNHTNMAGMPSGIYGNAYNWLYIYSFIFHTTPKGPDSPDAKNT